MIRVAQYTLPEVFAKLPTLKKQTEKIEWLQKNLTPTMRWFLISVFSEKPIYDLKIPEYKPSIFPVGATFTTLHHERKMLSLIEINSYLKQNRKEANLLRILEGVSKEEALLLEQAIRGKCKVPGLTYLLAKKAFDFIPERKK